MTLSVKTDRAASYAKKVLEEKKYGEKINEKDTITKVR